MTFVMTAKEGKSPYTINDSVTSTTTLWSSQKTVAMTPVKLFYQGTIGGINGTTSQLTMVGGTEIVAGKFKTAKAGLYQITLNTNGQTAFNQAFYCYYDLNNVNAVLGSSYYGGVGSLCTWKTLAVGDIIGFKGVVSQAGYTIYPTYLNFPAWSIREL